MTTPPIALITGGSSGIGATFARQLAARGYSLVLVARRAERMHALAAELPNTAVEVVVADLATDEGVEDVLRRMSTLPRLDLLVNNAGFGTKGRFADIDAGPQETMHRLHVLATVRLTHAALQRMKAQQRGGIINVASVAGFLHAAGSVSYNATKHWMVNFSEGLHLELRSTESPVRVQALCPGYTYSEFHDVVGMDRSLVPRWLWLEADRVVADSLRGLERGQWLVVPGWFYRALVTIQRFFPAPLRHWFAVQAGRRMKRD
jgi:hypothetical protein